MECGKVFYFGIVIVFCLLLSSCKHQPLQQKDTTIDQVSVDNQRNILLDTIIQQEAMLVDIPIPLYDERIIPFFDPAEIAESDTLVFGYKSPLACAQAQAFFMTQMERYGWQHLVSFNTTELLLQFASPDRYCTVVIKNADQNSSYIFIYIKKSEF